MRCVKFLFALVAILAIWLPSDVTAVTCNVAPLDPSCINCELNPLHVECTVTSTTAIPVTTIPTTKTSRRRRAQKFLSNFFNRIKERLQQIKKKMNPF
ncbi:hypothetical protein ACLKA6_004050 [Drosophila palustris]